jgi:chemotaxis protein histidine kinase CheA
MAIVENPEMYREFLVQVNETLEHLRADAHEMIVAPAEGDQPREILREVHTLKGTSSAFGAYAIAGLSGELEDTLSGIHTSGTAESVVREVERILACLLREFEAIRDRAASILGDDVREDTEPYLRVPLRELKLLQETARRISGEECRELARRLKALCMVPVGKGLGRAFRIADDLVDRTRKSVEIRFEGGDILIEYEIARELNTPILHLVRNAIRHGIEDPADRIAAGKPERGLVVLTVRNFNGTLMVEFSDDGSGLDPERIRIRAVEKLFISAEEAERLTHEECLNLIFIPGFSTTENLDAISGRGMGLDVVRSAIMKLNGHIEIDRTTRVGTKFVITIPISSDD